jgi:hypothetical protein
LPKNLKQKYKLTLRSQANCLVAQADTQSNPAKEFAYAKARQTETAQQIDRKIIEDKKHQTVTKNIRIGVSVRTTTFAILNNDRAARQERSPQSAKTTYNFPLV